MEDGGDPTSSQAEEAKGKANEFFKSEKYPQVRVGTVRVHCVSCTVNKVP